ncbi:MAG: nitroreductase, partial [Betaproteobacteria bacterium]|nr:nitroreductase [Betaproteobacteria bacterium]
GWAVPDALINTFVTPRESVDSFTHWCDSAA